MILQDKKGVIRESLFTFRLKTAGDKSIKWRLFFAVFWFTLLLGAGSAFADNISRIQAARHFVELTFDQELYQANARSNALAVIKAKYENDPKTKPHQETIVKALMEVIEMYITDPETMAKIKNISVQLYAGEFTETELLEMSKFFATDVGKKTLRKLPLIMKKQWQIESRMNMPERYEAMIINKLKEFQQKGMLPKEQ